MQPPSRTDQNSSLRELAPAARLAAIADPGSVEWLDAPRPSHYLGRFGITPQNDDGVVTARLRIDLRTYLAAAQDERFLRGSVGAAHGEALRQLFERAQRERPHGIVLLMASAGVRLHEANPAELALAHALRAMLDARASAIPIHAIAVGDVFGGASVLMCAVDRVAALPEIRLGLSGPKVVQTARGTGELDASDPAQVNALYGAEQRIRASLVDGIDDSAASVLAWLHQPASSASFEATITARGAILQSAAASPHATADLPRQWKAQAVGAGLWRRRDAWIVAPFATQPVDAATLSALDAALLAQVGLDGDRRPLVLLEDSPGHDVSREAERLFLSRYLAHHACVLKVLRVRGIHIAGALIGTAHSAAFFVNALQGDRLCAIEGARVIAMAPDAIARVTGLDAATLIESDPLLGQPLRHLASFGGVDSVLPDARPAPILEFARFWAGG
jgi:malonate decarboxylase beta subunit